MRSPPIKITVGAGWPCSRAVSAASNSKLAAGSELVMMVKVGKCSNSVRARATAKVVVPPERAKESWGRTSLAAASAIWRFSLVCCSDLVAKRGSIELGPAATAPPWTRSTRPALTSSVMSRRTVISEMPNASTTSATRTPPLRVTKSMMKSWRWRASMGVPVLSLTVDILPYCCFLLAL